MEISQFLSVCFMVTIYLIAIVNSNNGVVEASHRVYPQLLSGNSTEQATTFSLLSIGSMISKWPHVLQRFVPFVLQYNPKGAVWGNIVWAHSVSKDLVNWQSLGFAISPTAPFDIKGCWSGSATILPGNKPVILYTGIDSQNNQVQNYALPENASDPYLRTWKKPDGNPVIAADKGMNASAFRDPTTAWQANGYWNLLVGSQNNLTGMAYLFKSKDFKKWTKARQPLYSAPNTGVWECPDFYSVSVSDNKKGLDTSAQGNDVKHALKVSLDLTRYDYYTVGTYYPDQDKYVPDKDQVDGRTGLRYDYGNFYDTSGPSPHVSSIIFM